MAYAIIGEMVGEMIANSVIFLPMKFIRWFLVIVAVIAITFICTKKFVKDTKFESKTILTPTIKLHTDGKTIDTIYVYALKP